MLTWWSDIYCSPTTTMHAPNMWCVGTLDAQIFGFQLPKTNKECYIEYGFSSLNVITKYLVFIDDFFRNFDMCCSWKTSSKMARKIRKTLLKLCSTNEYPWNFQNPSFGYRSTWGFGYVPDPSLCRCNTQIQWQKSITMGVV